MGNGVYVGYGLIILVIQQSHFVRVLVRAHFVLTFYSIGLLNSQLNKRGNYSIQNTAVYTEN